MGSVADRQADKRKAKLDDVQKQIDAGTLKVRKMTAAEKKRYGPKGDPPAQPRRRSRG